jgi:hypothetical protein
MKIEDDSSSTSDGNTDPLAAIISLLRPQTVLSKVITGSGKWSVQKPRYEDPAFCLLLNGSCYLAPEGVDAIELSEGRTNR